jgi:hypothetical protein
MARGEDRAIGQTGPDLLPTGEGIRTTISKAASKTMRPGPKVLRGGHEKICFKTKILGLLPGIGIS